MAAHVQRQRFMKSRRLNPVREERFWMLDCGLPFAATPQRSGETGV